MRRRSQQLHGVPPALAQELAAIDEEFYGSDGSSDSDDSDQPMAKRARGAREREDEYFSDSGEASGSRLGAAVLKVMRRTMTVTNRFAGNCRILLKLDADAVKQITLLL